MTLHYLKGHLHHQARFKTDKSPQRARRSSDVTNASRSLRMKTAITNQVKTAIETRRWLKTTRKRCFTGFRDDLCCQNSTLENKKAIRDDKLTRVLGEGKCLFIDMFSRFLKIQTVINFKNLECIQILLLFRIFCHF